MAAKTNLTVPSGMQAEIKTLLAHSDGPCVSLYTTTHRRHPENHQDPIRYKNLMKVLEDSLLRRHSSRECQTLLDPLRALAADTQFWHHTWDGLAVLRSSSLFRVMKLHQPPSDLAVVADSFHIKPLLREMQSADRYQVLFLSRGKIRLYEGNRDRLDELELAAGVPRTVQEALGSEHTEPHQTVASYGGTAQGSNMRHGHGSKPDEAEIDEVRFFRAVDRSIFEYYSRPSETPLMLAALPEYHAAFRRLSHNPFLMDKGIEMDVSSLSAEQLRDRAWAVLEPEFRSRLRELAASFEEARGKRLGTDDLAEVAHAAAASRVDSLLVEMERRIPGRLDAQTGDVQLDALDDPQGDHLLDDLAELVLNRGGSVVVAPAAGMPGAIGVAATFRW